MPYKLLTLLWGTICLVASARPGDYSAKLVREFGCQPTLDPYVSFWGRVPGLLRLVAEQDLDLTRNSQNVPHSPELSRGGSPRDVRDEGRYSPRCAISPHEDRTRAARTRTV